VALTLEDLGVLFARRVLPEDPIPRARLNLVVLDPGQQVRTFLPGHGGYTPRATGRLGWCQIAMIRASTRHFVGGDERTRTADPLLAKQPGSCAVQGTVSPGPG
jgi:hypothetical protein